MTNLWFYIAHVLRHLEEDFATWKKQYPSGEPYYSPYSTRWWWFRKQPRLRDWKWYLTGRSEFKSKR